MNELNDVNRILANEKTQVSKLQEQNHELIIYIKSLESIRDKMIEKVESLNSNRGDSAHKIKILEEQLTVSKTQNSVEIKKYVEDFEKVSNEYSILKQEIKRKTEENIISKAENRKLFQEKNESLVLIQKLKEQEDFHQKLLKSSEAEIQKIIEKQHTSNRASDEKDIKISQLNSEIYCLKSQIATITADLNKTESSLKMLNLENYSLQSKIEELDKVRSQSVGEDSIREEYYKLLRAYQHLSDDFKVRSISINESQIEKSVISNSFGRKTEKSIGDENCFMNEIEKLQIRLQGVYEEKGSIERKLEFTMKENRELKTTVEVLKEEVRIHEIDKVKSENIMKEVMRYKNEIIKVESEQNLLKKELEQALSKLQSSRNKTHCLEESMRKQKRTKD